MSKRFKPQDYFRYGRVGTSWRKPKGRQSKMREKIGTKCNIVSIGYGTDNKQKHTINGVRYVHVYNVAQLQNVKGKSVIIASGVGLKNVIDIAAKAKELGIHVINMGKVKNTRRKIALNKKMKEQRIADAKKKEEDKKKSEKKEDAKKENMKKEEAKKEEAIVKKEHAEHKEHEHKEVVEEVKKEKKEHAGKNKKEAKDHGKDKPADKK